MKDVMSEGWGEVAFWLLFLLVMAPFAALVLLSAWRGIFGATA